MFEFDIAKDLLPKIRIYFMFLVVVTPKIK